MEIPLVDLREADSVALLGLDSRVAHTGRLQGIPIGIYGNSPLNWQRASGKSRVSDPLFTDNGT